MQKKIRIIPRLDIKGPNVVKGIQMEGLRVVGRPELFAPYYYEAGADEIIYMDTVASLYGRNNLDEIIHRAAEKLYIPLTVGGGIRTIDDIKKLLRAGADKVAINTGAIKNPHLITEGANRYGAQCIVISIEARKTPEGWYECLTDNGREKTGVNAVEWAQKVVELGAGEIMLTSVTREGTGKGFDLELTQLISSSVPIPVIAAGGAGSFEHIQAVIQEGQADAVALASILHYGLLETVSNQGKYVEEGNTDFLNKKLSLGTHLRKNIKPTNLLEIKNNLQTVGIQCRMQNNIIRLEEGNTI